MDLEKNKEFVHAIYASLYSLNKVWRVPFMNNREQFETRLNEFMTEVDSSYPTAVLDTLDALNMAAKGYYFPSTIAMKIIKKYLKVADFYRGELYWKYFHPNLTATFIPKHTGARYVIEFISTGNFPLSFPLTVKVTVYSDMDEQESHNEYCPVFYPDHDEDCPMFRTSMDDENAEECECAAEDCNCEAEVVRVEEITYDDRKDFLKNFGTWLFNAHYGNE